MIEFLDFLNRISDKKKLLPVKKKKMHVKWIYKYTELDDSQNVSVVSEGFFDIVDVSYYSYMNDTYKFNLKIKWHTMQKTDEDIYTIDLSRKKRIYYGSKLKEDIKCFTHCSNELFEVYKSYISQVILEELNVFQKTNYIGWNKEDDKYWGISKYGNALGYEYPKLFNGEIKDYKRMYETMEIEDFSPLLKMICRDENTLGIFAYTIHSLYYFFGEGGKHPDFDNSTFSICIHGKDIEKVFMVSNLFSNVFDYDMNNMYRLPLRSVISCTSIENTYVKYYRLESVPMIVVHKTNRITRNTSIIRTLHKGRKQGEIGFYPVYVSQCALNVDEIIDFNVDNIFIEENLPQVKRQINSILVFFICFLEQLLEEENDNDCDKLVIESLYGNEINRMYQKNQYDLSDIKVMSKALLYIACKGFAYFLKHKLKRQDLYDIVIKQSRKYFLENKPISTEEPYTDGMKSFLLYINNILAREEQERPFLCVTSKEKRGGEKCIYIDYKKGYKSYKVDCGQKQIVCLEYNVLLKHLKQNKLLKMRTSQAQYLMQRTIEYKGKKQKQLLLVIFYDVFEQLLDDA